MKMPLIFYWAAKFFARREQERQMWDEEKEQYRQKVWDEEQKRRRASLYGPDDEPAKPL